MSQAKQVPDRLNLGCGKDYREEWWNVDVSDAVDPDQRVDLDETPWPFPDEHFTHVEARHVFEHLSDPIAALEEVARILVDGGTIELVYPIGHTRFEDPTHRQFWGVYTAEAVAGERNHAHEVDVPLELVDQTIDWQLSYPEPLSWLYTHYRVAVAGPGPWLEQVPGVYGEVSATFKHIAE